MTAPDYTELRPCPFCASIELGLMRPSDQRTGPHWHDWFIRCYGCHVETSEYPTEAEAIAAWNQRADDTAIAELQAQVAAMRGKVGVQAHELADKDRALHTKNIALDGMAWVWCDGGCPGGTARFSDIEITEEMVAMIERNTKRLRTWFMSRAALQPKDQSDV